jgi:DNA-binding NtrC family response regulator
VTVKGPFGEWNAEKSGAGANFQFGRLGVDKELLQVSFLSHDGSLGEAVARALGDGFSLRTNGATRLDQLQEVLSWSDVVLLDLRHSNDHAAETGFRLLDDINAQPAHPPVLVLCDAEDRVLLLKTIEKGATDSVPNPPNIMELRLLFRRAYRMTAAERELRQLRALESGGRRLHGLLGSSSAMQELFALADRIASCDVNVLITGETGTGKELLARAIHHRGMRASGPLVAFSCANLPENLVEDELFGHEKGAFTGAFLSRQGRVEAANHGTLFLDEIGDLGLGLQSKFLRVLQEKSFERLGSNKTINVDIRLISATNRNLIEMVQQGKFREDLYYRLNVVELRLPPLRERRDDISLLAHHFLQRCSENFHKKARRFAAPVLQALEQYNWPGNVRELENVVQRAVVLSDGPTIDVAQLPPAMRAVTIAEEPVAQPPAPAEQGAETPIASYEEEIRRFKRNLILRTLREYGWRKAESARALGVARGYLHRLIHQLEIQEEETDVAEKETDNSPIGPVM